MMIMMIPVIIIIIIIIIIIRTIFYGLIAQRNHLTLRLGATKAHF